MKRLLLIGLALICISCISLAQNVLTVADTNIPQGERGELIIGFQFAEEYEINGYQFFLALPEGVSLVPNGKSYLYVKGDGYHDDHIINIKYNENKEKYFVYCVAIPPNEEPVSYAFSVPSGILIKLPIQADESLTKGTSLNASLNDIHLSTEGGTDISLSDVSFRVVIGEASDIRTELFETSTDLPEEATNVNVRVYRTINANEWSTICLPFAMTEQQITTAFGEAVTVELADADSYETTEDDAGDIVGINIKFNNVTAIEANHPYIIRVSKEITSFDVDGVDVAPAERERYRRKSLGAGSYFVGNYVNQTEVPEFCLFLSGNKFWYSIGDTKIKAFRGYFNLRDILTSVEDASYSSRIAISFDNTNTGINEVVNHKSSNDKYFDLQGRSVPNPGNGLFVKDGKKVIFK